MIAINFLTHIDQYKSSQPNLNTWRSKESTLQTWTKASSKGWNLAITILVGLSRHHHPIKNSSIPQTWSSHPKIEGRMPKIAKLIAQSIFFASMHAKWAIKCRKLSGVKPCRCLALFSYFKLFLVIWSHKN